MIWVLFEVVTSPPTHVPNLPLTCSPTASIAALSVLGWEVRALSSFTLPWKHKLWTAEIMLGEGVMWGGGIPLYLHSKVTPC